MQFYISFFVAFIFVVITIPFVISICRTYKLFDTPNQRKLHTQAIPRLGGMVFMPATTLAMCVGIYFVQDNSYAHIDVHPSMVLMVLGAFMIYIIGIFDDLYGVKAKYKFIIQTISALLMPLCGLMVNNLYGIFYVYEMPLVVSYFVTVLLILLIVNAINLIDGIDGLASSLSFLMLCAFAYLFWTMGAFLFTMLSLGAAGAVLAFFLFNMFGKGRRKIFMGDTGSLFLGYVISYLVIKFPMYNNVYPFRQYREDSVLISFTLVAIPMLDLMRVAIARLAHGRSIFSPDKTHIHHILMQAGLTMHQALVVILCIFLMICALNYGGYCLGVQYTYIVLVDILFYLCIVYCLFYKVKTAHGKS